MSAGTTRRTYYQQRRQQREITSYPETSDPVVHTTGVVSSYPIYTVPSEAPPSAPSLEYQSSSHTLRRSMGSPCQTYSCSRAAVPSTGYCKKCGKRQKESIQLKPHEKSTVICANLGCKKNISNPGDEWCESCYQTYLSIKPNQGSWL